MRVLQSDPKLQRVVQPDVAFRADESSSECVVVELSVRCRTDTFSRDNLALRALVFSRESCGLRVACKREHVCNVRILELN